MLEKRIRIEYGLSYMRTIIHWPRKPSIVGKMARISKIKGLFEKRYMPNLIEEHFHIKSRIPKRMPVFKLADHLGDNRKGQF